MYKIEAVDKGLNMKLKDLLNVTFDETWVKILDTHDTHFVWVADYIGGDKETLDTLQPLLDREVVDVSTLVSGTPENKEAHEPILVVNLA